jgi:hypothetical protein
LRRFEKIVSISPQIYPSSELKQEYRRAVISKQISVLYSIEDSIVKVHTVFDNREDPSSILQTTYFQNPSSVPRVPKHLPHLLHFQVAPLSLSKQMHLMAGVAVDFQNLL